MIAIECGVSPPSLPVKFQIRLQKGVCNIAPFGRLLLVRPHDHRDHTSARSFLTLCRRKFDVHEPRATRLNGGTEGCHLRFSSKASVMASCCHGATDGCVYITYDLRTPESLVVCCVHSRAFSACGSANRRSSASTLSFRSAASVCSRRSAWHVGFVDSSVLDVCYPHIRHVEIIATVSSYVRGLTR